MQYPAFPASIGFTAVFPIVTGYSVQQQANSPNRSARAEISSASRWLSQQSRFHLKCRLVGFAPL
jgi:hypothetical protein